jgi:hypothetical protein
VPVRNQSRKKKFVHETWKLNPNVRLMESCMEHQHYCCERLGGSTLMSHHAAQAGAAIRDRPKPLLSRHLEAVGGEDCQYFFFMAIGKVGRFQSWTGLIILSYLFLYLLKHFFIKIF